MLKFGCCAVLGLMMLSHVAVAAKPAKIHVPVCHLNNASCILNVAALTSLGVAQIDNNFAATSLAYTSAVGAVCGQYTTAETCGAAPLQYTCNWSATAQSCYYNENFESSFLACPGSQASLFFGCNMYSTEALCNKIAASGRSCFFFNNQCVPTFLATLGPANIPAWTQGLATVNSTVWGCCEGRNLALKYLACRSLTTASACKANPGCQYVADALFPCDASFSAVVESVFADGKSSRLNKINALLKKCGGLDAESCMTSGGTIAVNLANAYKLADKPFINPNATC